MKVAVLVNHPTAGIFYAEIFKRLGWIVYVPLKCSVLPIFTDDKVLKVRNTLDDEETKILDNYDFYNQSAECSGIVQTILKFDLVITYHAINCNLNRFLAETHPRVGFIVWGREVQDHFEIYRHIGIYDLVMSSKSSFFAIAHGYILKDLECSVKYIDLPIGLPKINKVWNGQESKIILTVISRCFLPQWSKALTILKILARDLPEFQFILCGVDNGSFSDDRVISHTLKELDDVYELMAKSRLGISFSFHENILQYSTIEMATIGLPFIYQEGSAASRTLSSNPEGRHTFQLEVESVKNTIIKCLTDEHTSQTELAEKYSIDNVIDKWKILL